MNQALIQFEKHLNQVKELHIRYVYFKTALPADDLSDLLRSEIVYGISAFDKLIHDLVKIGMLETYAGLRIETVQYKAFKISVETLSKIQNPSGSPPEFWFENEIKNQHKLLSFQEPKKVNDALNLISDTQYKWQVIATTLGKTESDTKTYLSNLVNRRNAIVHEADEDPLTGDKISITELDVKNDIDFILNLGKAIFDLVKKNNTP